MVARANMTQQEIAQLVENNPGAIMDPELRQRDLPEDANPGTDPCLSALGGHCIGVCISFLSRTRW